MSKTVAGLIFAVTLILIIGGLFLTTRKPAGSAANLDDFAKCLTSKGMTMYGAYWCPHCQKIKKMFADSFQYVKYVECTVETQLCTDKNVAGYPTFIWGDGSRSEGELTLSEFSQKSSCPLSGISPASSKSNASESGQSSQATTPLPTNSGK